MLNGTFQSALGRKLNELSLPPAARATIEGQRSKLAAIETRDVRLKQAVEESFVSGYRAILWVAVSLALGSSLSAAVLISKEPASRRHDRDA
jgi:hypothetical protein